MVLLQDEFGWSSTIISLAFALTRVESGLLGPLQGWMADRFVITSYSIHYTKLYDLQDKIEAARLVAIARGSVWV